MLKVTLKNGYSMIWEKDVALFMARAYCKNGMLKSITRIH